MSPPNLGSTTRSAMYHIATRVYGRDPNFNLETPCFLQRFIEAKETHPDVVHDGMVVIYLLANLAAGTDTVVIMIRAIVYFVLKNPEVHRKLRDETLAAKLGKVAQYIQARALPCECNRCYWR